MHSAISELNAICVSAVIHEGWVKPVELIRNGEVMHVIARRVDARSLGGHTFALVGYNEVGFLVQNSWSSEWGKGGFATLPYEDWLKSAYDAWVARPGVPQTLFASGRSTTVTATRDDSHRTASSSALPSRSTEFSGTVRVRSSTRPYCSD